jgi:hypothetical protein
MATGSVHGLKTLILNPGFPQQPRHQTITSNGARPCYAYRKVLALTSRFDLIIYAYIMPIDFKQLLSDPRLLKLFRGQSGLDDEALDDMLTENDPSTFWQWLQSEETLVVHHAEGAGETCFGVYAWGGLFFAHDESRTDSLEGPFNSPEEAASRVDQLSLAELADTWGIAFEVHSTLPTPQALSIIPELISEGETLSLNGVNYLRESSGYVPA